MDQIVLYIFFWIIITVKLQKMDTWLYNCTELFEYRYWNKVTFKVTFGILFSQTENTAVLHQHFHLQKLITFWKTTKHRLCYSNWCLVSCFVLNKKNTKSVALLAFISTASVLLYFERKRTIMEYPVLFILKRADLTDLCSRLRHVFFCREVVLINRAAGSSSVPLSFPV